MTKDRQLNLRVSLEELEVVKRGAELARMSRTAFVMKAATAMTRLYIEREGSTVDGEPSIDIQSPKIKHSQEL